MPNDAETKPCRKCGRDMKKPHKSAAWACPNGCDQWTAAPTGNIGMTRNDTGGLADHYRRGPTNREE